MLALATYSALEHHVVGSGVVEVGGVLSIGYGDVYLSFTASYVSSPYLFPWVASVCVCVCVCAVCVYVCV